MSNLIYTQNGQVIELADTPLATPGGEGAVYRIKKGHLNGDYCVKIYHSEKRTTARFAKITYMVGNPPKTLHHSNYTICWPLETVFDVRKNFSGFIMPLAFPESEKLYELTTLKIRNNLRTRWQKFDRDVYGADLNRLKLSVNIAIAVHAIHAVRKYTIVDYKPQNLLITLNGKVSLTDIDSIQIADQNTVLHHAEVTTSEYAPPECKYIHPNSHYVAESWDRFSLAVSFYELFLGLHPFAATAGGVYSDRSEIGEKINAGLFVYGSKRSQLSKIPEPHQRFTELPNSIQQLFIQAFDSGVINPFNRPSAQAWGQTINQELPNFQPRKPVLTLPSKPPITSNTGSYNGSIPIGQFKSGQVQQPPISYQTWVWIGAIAFIGLIIFISRSGQNATSDSAATTLTAKVQPVVKIIPTKNHSKRKLSTIDSTIPKSKIPPCITETANILLTNTTDHTLNLHISIFSNQTGHWGSWMDFPNVQPHVSNQAVTNPEGTQILSAHRYRFYAEYSDSPDGDGRYSKEQPHEVSKCDEGDFTIRF